ncbi:exostosin family protein [Fontisphaera persica]|uniref:exostosin domain-containing protein n=1 Tax=Fontisphaera persica TaxID=2974023 RepID=UPI0024BF9F05|nr:exostosin family protein [Fontisphaera persica]WCJ59684.1 exostosin family protein [Fontisphaera persica]
MRKRFLYSFVGRDACRLRNILFEIHEEQKYSDVVVRKTRGTSGYYSATEEEKNKMREDYLEIMGKSLFSLCPRGVGLSSIRLFESMEMGVAPVIIADDWLPCYGPKWD